jgi:inhibitor of KinA
MTGRPDSPRLLDAGETALVVEFGQTISDDLTDRVMALDRAFTDDPPEGVLECVPTYRSLMIHYDPLTLSRDALARIVRDRLTRPQSATRSPVLWCIPACYDPDFAEDLPFVAGATGLSADEVIRLHSTATYRVAMYGFAPGWAYLSGLPAALALPRRASPRARIPGQSLIVAGGQAIVAGDAMPSGWHILGRTPERLFTPGRTPPFLVGVGDRITFRPVTRPEFDALTARVAQGEVLAERVGGDG